MGKLKIGIFVDNLGMSIRDGIRKAAELGVECFQVFVTDGELAPWNLDATGRQEFKEFVAEQNLVISALCADFGKGFVDPNENDQLIPKTKQITDLAVDLGVSIITTHIGEIPEDDQHPHWIACREAIKDIGDYSIARGVQFAAETGPESGAVLAKFLDDTATEGARVNFDPANLCMWGFDHLQSARELGDRIIHAHAKDGIFNTVPDYQEVPLGEGDVNFPEYLKVIDEIGFDGYHVIEREVGDDPVGDVAKAVKFLRQF